MSESEGVRIYWGDEWSADGRTMLSGGGTQRVRVVDIDGDDHLDVVVGARIQWGSETGPSVDRVTSLPTFFAGARDSAVGDFDGDGHLDLHRRTRGLQQRRGRRR